MDEKTAIDFVKSALDAYRSKKPTTLIALICAGAWVATVSIIGKTALLLAIPATLLVMIHEME